MVIPILKHFVNGFPLQSQFKIWVILKGEKIWTKYNIVDFLYLLTSCVSVLYTSMNGL